MSKFQAASLKEFLLDCDGVIFRHTRDEEVPDVIQHAVRTEVRRILDLTLTRLLFQEQTEAGGASRSGRVTVMPLAFGDFSNFDALVLCSSDLLKNLSLVPRIVANILQRLGARLVFMDHSDGATMMLKRD